MSPFQPVVKHRSPIVSAVQASLCEQALIELLASDAGILAATLATADGFEIASRGETTRVIDGKLAAITSSLQALGGAVTDELGIGALESVVIEARTGRMLCIEIPLGPVTLVLASIAAKNALLARSLFATRDCAKRISAAWADGHAGA